MLRRQGLREGKIYTKIARTGRCYKVATLPRGAKHRYIFWNQRSHVLYKAPHTRESSMKKGKKQRLTYKTLTRQQRSPPKQTKRNKGGNKSTKNNTQQSGRYKEKNTTLVVPETQHRKKLRSRQEPGTKHEEREQQTNVRWPFSYRMEQN